MRARDGWISGASTADQLAVRRHNLAVVMEHLRVAGPASRARIDDLTLGIHALTGRRFPKRLGQHEKETA